MNYDGWQVRDFQYIGLKVDLPKQADDSPSAKGAATVSFSMHYLSPPPGIVDDATVFVNIYVVRIPFAALAEKLASAQKSNLYKQSTEEENKVWIWRYAFQLTTTRWDEKGTYSYYRRDVKLNDTEILHAYAEVLNAGPQESRAADHAAVKRILDSIQPL